MEKIASHFLRCTLIPAMLLVVVSLAHGTSSSKGGETILSGGQAAEMSGDSVKVIPISAVPVKLQGTLDTKKAKSGRS